MKACVRLLDADCRPDKWSRDGILVCKWRDFLYFMSVCWLIVNFGALESPGISDGGIRTTGSDVGVGRAEGRGADVLPGILIARSLRTFLRTCLSARS
jgi:hypothetical protein